MCWTLTLLLKFTDLPLKMGPDLLQAGPRLANSRHSATPGTMCGHSLRGEPVLPPPHTRANGPARTSLQTAGLCEPTTGQARWQGPGLLASTFLLKWSHRHLWLPRPPGLVSLFEVMLYCTLEAFPSPSPTRRFSSGRPWKADGSTEQPPPGQEECRERGRRASPPPNQSSREFLWAPARETRGNSARGDGHQGGNQETLVSGSLFGTSDKSVNMSGPVLSPVN